MARQRMYSENVGGNWGLPAGYMEAATAPGRSYASAISSVGSSIAGAITKYQENKAEDAYVTGRYEALAPFIKKLAEGGNMMDPNSLESKTLVQAEKFHDGSLAQKKAALHAAEFTLSRFDKQEETLRQDAAIGRQEDATRFNQGQSLAALSFEERRVALAEAAAALQAARDASHQKQLDAFNATVRDLPTVKVTPGIETITPTPVSGETIGNIISAYYENGTEPPPGFRMPTQDTINQFVSSRTQQFTPPPEKLLPIPKLGEVTRRNPFRLGETSVTAPAIQDRFDIPMVTRSPDTQTKMNWRDGLGVMQKRFVEAGGQITPEMNANLTAQARDMYDPVVEIRLIGGGFVQKFVDGKPVGEMRELKPDELKEFEVRFGDKTMWGHTTSKEGKLEVIKSYASTKTLIESVDALIKLTNTPGISTLPTKEAVLAKQYAAAIMAALRTPIVGAGAVSEGEWTMLRTMVADPTNMASRDVNTIAALQNLKEIMTNSFSNVAHANGLPSSGNPFKQAGGEVRLNYDPVTKTFRKE